MSMEYIRKNYGVPAKRGGRVEFTGISGIPKPGTIKSASGQYLRILLDGAKRPGTYHPTWNVRYLEAKQEVTNGGS